MRQDWTELEQKAMYFAFAAHAAVDQRRKYTGQPYFEHVRQVAETVKNLAYCHETVVAAAFLHDTVEDTLVTRSNIEQMFGRTVSMLVWEVTDLSKLSDGNRKARKLIDLNHLAQASAEGQTIKLADLIDNTSTITEYDAKFAQVYMEEKKNLLEVLTKGDADLHAKATTIVRNWYDKDSFTV